MEAPTESPRVVLVTGASRGIGAAIARAFAAQGCVVVINHSGAHSAKRACELAAQLTDEHGVTALAIQADVSSFEEAGNLITCVKERFGRIDVLVNNAGITRDGLLMRMKEQDFDDVISVNLKGAFNCLRHVTPLMVKQRGGRIVNVSSAVGLAGNAGQANYAAAKAGLIGLTKSAAKELARRGITVNAVAPGFISTDMTDALSEATREAAKERIACGRFGTPEDVAFAVTMLASPQAGYLTGQVLSIDGGMAL